MKGIGKYWGYPLLLLIFGGWISEDIGPTVLLAASLLAGAWFLFRAPVWCGARTRQDERCRNNASGLLMGCRLRQHKWQNLRALLNIPQWSDLVAGMMTGAAQRVATLSMVATMLSAVIAALTLVTS